MTDTEQIITGSLGIDHLDDLYVLSRQSYRDEMAIAGLSPRVVEDCVRRRYEGEAAFTTYEQRFRMRLQNSCCDAQGAFLDGKVIGSLFGLIDTENNSTIHLFGLQVDQSVRRQGIARRLTNIFLNQYSDLDMTLNVFESNEPARRLYESLGFKEVDREIVIIEGQAISGLQLMRERNV